MSHPHLQAIGGNKRRLAIHPLHVKRIDADLRERVCLEVMGSEGIHRVAAPVSISPGQGSGPAKCPSGTHSFRRVIRGTASTAMTMTKADKPWAAPLGDPEVAGRRRRLVLRCLPSAYIRNQKLAMYF